MGKNPHEPHLQKRRAGGRRLPYRPLVLQIKQYVAETRPSSPADDEDEDTSGVGCGFRGEYTFVYFV